MESITTNIYVDGILWKSSDGTFTSRLIVEAMCSVTHVRRITIRLEMNGAILAKRLMC